MKIVKIESPFIYGISDSEMADAEKHLEKVHMVGKAIEDGKVHVRFHDGDRKGSIARLQPDGEIDYPEIVRGRSNTHNFSRHHFFTIATWDGRRNKVKLAIPDREVEILLDYEGPTIWEKFDAKAAKEEILKTPNQRDINGKMLSVGDTVLYINARYGSRMVLEEGTITEFAASVNSKDHTIATIIKSKTGEISSLQYPESMVYLKP